MKNKKLINAISKMLIASSVVTAGVVVGKTIKRDGDFFGNASVVQQAISTLKPAETSETVKGISEDGVDDIINYISTNNNTEVLNMNKNLNNLVVDEGSIQTNAEINTGKESNESLVDEFVLGNEASELTESEFKNKSINVTSDTNTKNDSFSSGEICINNSDFKLSEELYNNIIDAIKSVGFSTGFYLTDAETKMTISYNADKDFQPASSIKAGLALSVIKDVASGERSFDDMVTYKSGHYVAGSGTIKNSQFGTEYSVKDLLHNLINISDNIAYYMLQDSFGVDNYNEMISDLGCKTWINGFKNGHPAGTLWGYITPQELNLIWQEIYEYGKTTDEGKWLFQEFLDAKYNYIKEALPQYEVAHKSGWNNKGYHDSAVVFGDRTYILTIMTTCNGLVSHNDYLSKIANYLNDAESEYITYLENVGENLSYKNEKECMANKEDIKNDVGSDLHNDIGMNTFLGESQKDDEIDNGSELGGCN